jgi:hemin uptake protein HemP
MTPNLTLASRPSAAPLPPAPTSSQQTRARRRVSSQALLANEREIEIEHVGQLYRLRLTALGKLILTK